MENLLSSFNSPKSVEPVLLKEVFLSTLLEIVDLIAALAIF
jgi:hypothetical protein